MKIFEGWRFSSTIECLAGMFEALGSIVRSTECFLFLKYCLLLAFWWFVSPCGLWWWLTVVLFSVLEKMHLPIGFGKSWLTLSLVSGLGQMIHLFLNQCETLNLCVLNTKQKDLAANHPVSCCSKCSQNRTAFFFLSPFGFFSFWY